MRTITALSGMMLLAAALGLAGCNPQDTQNLSVDTRHIAQDTGQALGNAKLAASVNTVLALRKGVDMSGLHVDVKDGVVTLGGHVRNAAERRRVVDTVENTRGVDKVINNLRIQP
ncbi:MAG TPA: BON domain-containing protein [Chthonomonadaceae bacterium]|nr:BON domain-containing protein [Chthonomonadaceae bacterium]